MTTAVAIEVALRLHYDPTFVVPKEARYANALRSLIDNGILEVDLCALNKLQFTQKGTAWIGMLVSTPYPVNEWRDPREGS